MKSFRFPLERVREWRAGQVEIEENHLRRLMVERSELIARRDWITEDCRGREVALVRASSVDGAALGALESYRRWAKVQTAMLTSQISEVDTRVAAQRARLAEAQRNCKLLEKLKDRAHRQWQKAADAKLETLAGEAFLAKWQRE